MRPGPDERQMDFAIDSFLQNEVKYKLSHTKQAFALIRQQRTEQIILTCGKEEISKADFGPFAQVVEDPSVILWEFKYESGLKEAKFLFLQHFHDFNLDADRDSYDLYLEKVKKGEIMVSLCSHLNDEWRK